MKKFLRKVKESFNNLIGDILEEEYIDLCWKQDLLNKNR